MTQPVLSKLSTEKWANVSSLSFLFYLGCRRLLDKSYLHICVLAAQNAQNGKQEGTFTHFMHKITALLLR